MKEECEVRAELRTVFTIYHKAVHFPPHEIQWKTIHPSQEEEEEEEEEEEIG